MIEKMNTALIFDGRNLFDPSEISSHGFTYYSVGRKVVEGKQKTSLFEKAA
jgi:UDPglucose 6-dehydrogenase